MPKKRSCGFELKHYYWCTYFDTREEAEKHKKHINDNTPSTEVEIIEEKTDATT